MTSNVLKIPVISRLRSTGGIADIFNTRWNIFFFFFFVFIENKVNFLFTFSVYEK